jgi:epoxyqueuosine reductase QueG
MAWLADKADRRRSPKAIWPEARTILVCGLNYGPDSDPRATLTEPDTGTISVYARHRDYHDVFKGALKRIGQWMAHRYGVEVKVFVDTAPILEKPLAQQAGLGWQGKHTNLVSCSWARSSPRWICRRTSRISITAGRAGAALMPVLPMPSLVRISWMRAAASVT